MKVSQKTAFISNLVVVQVYRMPPHLLVRNALS